MTLAFHGASNRLPPLLFRHCILLFFIYSATSIIAMAQEQLDDQHASSLPSLPCNRCPRSLLLTYWGCISTIVALGAEYYNKLGPRLRAIHSLGQAFPIILSVLSTPLLYPRDLIHEAMQGLLLQCSSRRKISRQKCKIIIACDVWINVPASRGNDFKLFGKIEEIGSIGNIEEALEYPSVHWNKPSPHEDSPVQMDACQKFIRKLPCVTSREETTQKIVIGADRNVIKLDLIGKKRFLESDLLPTYKQLMFLQTRSGFANAIAALQALGFLLGILGRWAQKLRISPLEALATPMGVLVLLQAGLHWVTAGSCQRPLIIHLNSEDEADKLLLSDSEHSNCIEYLKQYEKFLQYGIPVFLGTILAGPSIAFAVYFFKSKCLYCTHHLGSVAFQTAMLTYMPMLATRPGVQHKIWSVITISLLVFSFVLAVVVTAINWDLFSSEQKSIVTFIIPHVGN